MIKDPFNYDLFLSLNQEYSSKPLVRRAQKYRPVDLEARGRKRATGLVRNYGIRGKRVLEIGCGRGEVLRSLAQDFGCDCVGVDIGEYSQWENAPAGVAFHRLDLSTSSAPDIGVFDFIYSNAVWEHIRHPYSMLRKAYNLLKQGGEMYMSANLYRGPKASHRYREVFFPWPHLLFNDAIFQQFYAKTNKPHLRAAWVNKLTAAEYKIYFQDIGFELIGTSYQTTPIDEEFYARFSDILERYPRFDLERDFIEAHLRRPA